MDRDELTMTVADLVGVEPKSIGADEQASKAAQWIDLQKKTEAEADTLLDPAIREAFGKHRALTGEQLFEELLLLAGQGAVSIKRSPDGGIEQRVSFGLRLLLEVDPLRSLAGLGISPDGFWLDASQVGYGHA